MITLYDEALIRFLEPLLDFVRDEKRGAKLDNEKLEFVYVSQEFYDAAVRIEQGIDKLVIKGIPVKAASWLTGFAFASQLEER